MSQTILTILNLWIEILWLGKKKWTVRSNVDSNLNIQIRSSLGERRPGAQEKKNL
ncbi:hypothetical protein [Ligilactobacillus equi]|nr:hypothetical protein [Ligilactobacillus equi]